MIVVANQADEAYLLVEDQRAAVGRVYDVRSRTLYEPKSLAALYGRGYWSDFTGDQAAVLTLVRSPEKANPYHDDLGRFAAHGTGGDVKVRLTMVEGGQPFDGKPVPQFVAVGKLETGRVAEEAAKAYLAQVEGSGDVRTANTTHNNFPVDVAHDSQVVEVKGGRIDNPRDSQQWRVTLGQPGKEEAARVALMTKEERAEHNRGKVERAFQRKEDARSAFEELVGGTVKGRTIAAIVDHDRRQVHLYSFDGFHKRINWTSPEARAGFLGVFKYEPLPQKDWFPLPSNWLVGEVKFNPYHDERGRFSQSHGAAFVSFRPGTTSGPKPAEGAPKVGGEKLYPGQSDEDAASAAKATERSFDKWASIYGVPRDEAEAKAIDYVSEYLKNSDPVIRVSPGVLEQVVRDGRFKTQFETGTSEGLLNNEGRSNIEQRMFGIGHGSNPTARPVYGYMESRTYGVQDENRHADGYGDARVFLKPSVRDRTTFTVGDSFGPGYSGTITPAPLNKPAATAIDGMAPLTIGAVKNKTPRAEFSDDVAYVEAQFHGTIRTSDISHVDFGRAPSPFLAGALKRAGIRHEVRVSDLYAREQAQEAAKKRGVPE